MKGYKGTNKDMKCRGFPFEIGKKYTIEGKIEICKRGFHFCERLKDVFDYYDRDNGNRFFEVETDEPCISDGAKYCTNSIRFIKEIEPIIVNRSCDGYGDGNGDGYGYGYGYGNGNGYGNGYGYGYGDGNGYGYGDGDGNGYGNGYGDGDGYGNGYGYGNGNGYGINKILDFK